MQLAQNVKDPRIKKTFETLENKFNLIHNNRYTYKNAIFKGVEYKITVTCPVHGNWDILPTNHLAGNGCLKCFKEALPKTKDQFILDAIQMHGDKFDYSEVNYKTTHDKIKILCRICGYSFYQNTKSHISGTGCPSCSKNQRYTTKEYIEKAKKVHNNYYSYEKTEYITANKHIKITCPIHGDFKQKAGSHLHGAGCFACKPGGFDKTKPGRLYYLQVNINGIIHYKIGITNGTVKSRFKSAQDKNKITILKQTIYENGQDALNWEKFFKKRYKKYQYKGPKFFINSGETEVFTTDVLALFYKEKDNNEIDPKILPNGGN